MSSRNDLCEELLRILPSLLHCCMHKKCGRNKSIIDFLVELLLALKNEDIERPESRSDDDVIIDLTSTEGDVEPSDEGFGSFVTGTAESSQKRKHAQTTTDSLTEVKTDEKKKSPRKRVKLYSRPKEDDYSES